MRLRVIKDEVEFDLEVAERTDPKFPLWDPELFKGATVRIGKAAAFPPGRVAVQPVVPEPFEREKP